MSINNLMLERCINIGGKRFGRNLYIYGAKTPHPRDILYDTPSHHTFLVESDPRMGNNDLLRGLLDYPYKL